MRFQPAYSESLGRRYVGARDIVSCSRTFGRDTLDLMSSLKYMCRGEARTIEGSYVCSSQAKQKHGLVLGAFEIGEYWDASFKEGFKKKLLYAPTEHILTVNSSVEAKAIAGEEFDF